MRKSVYTQRISVGLYSHNSQIKIIHYVDKRVKLIILRRFSQNTSTF